MSKSNQSTKSFEQSQEHSTFSRKSMEIAQQTDLTNSSLRKEKATLGALAGFVTQISALWNKITGKEKKEKLTFSEQVGNAVFDKFRATLFEKKDQNGNQFYSAQFLGTIDFLGAPLLSSLFERKNKNTPWDEIVTQTKYTGIIETLKMANVSSGEIDSFSGDLDVYLSSASTIVSSQLLEDFKKESVPSLVEHKQVIDNPPTEKKGTVPEKNRSQIQKNIPLNIPLISDIDIREKYEALQGKEKPDFLPFVYALQGYNKLEHTLGNRKYLTVVDYSKSNKENRFFVINMETNMVEHSVPVGHGKRSGGEFATDFSNQVGSNKTSLGFYKTPKNITKANTKKWSGLLLSGIEESNERAKSRGIYIHPGSVKGSEGCFTLPKDSNEIMNKVKGDSLLFSYYPDKDYLAQSNYIDTTSIDTRMVA